MIGAASALLNGRVAGVSGVRNGAGGCPGPAVVALGAGRRKVWRFVASMIVGLRLVERFDQGAPRSVVRPP